MPEPLDTVTWERDGGLYSGIILTIRGDVADILTAHGPALVRTSDVRVLVPWEQWDREALRSHLSAVYGIEP